MKFVRSMIRSVVLGAIIVLASSIADAQQPARQPTRSVQGGPSSQTPQLDQRTGQFRIDRRVIRPGLRLLPQRPVPRWRLGIQVDDAPRGLRISDVSPNSPAFRFGLERGDYLLDVMGFPVGFHGRCILPAGRHVESIGAAGRLGERPRLEQAHSCRGSNLDSGRTAPGGSAADSPDTPDTTSAAGKLNRIENGQNHLCKPR